MRFGDILKNQSAVTRDTRESSTEQCQKFFCDVKIGILGAKYAIWRDSEKSALGDQRHLTVADRPDKSQK